MWAKRRARRIGEAIGIGLSTCVVVAIAGTIAVAAPAYASESGKVADLTAAPLASMTPTEASVERGAEGDRPDNALFGDLAFMSSAWVEYSAEVSTKSMSKDPAVQRAMRERVDGFRFPDNHARALAWMDESNATYDEAARLLPYAQAYKVARDACGLIESGTEPQAVAGAYGETPGAITLGDQPELVEAVVGAATKRGCKLD